MLEFVPEKVDRAVVMNVFQNQQPASSSLAAASVVDSFVGADFVVAAHNWIAAHCLSQLFSSNISGA